MDTNSVDDVRAFSTGQTGHGTGNTISWQSNECDFEITREQAKAAQRRSQHDPAGYGFFEFSCRKLDNGKWQARWACQASCD